MLPILQANIQEDSERDLHFDHGGNKMYFISLGCPRNLVDTEVMLGTLIHHGYEPTQELPDADYIIINTCGFLQASRQESLDTIKGCLQGKKANAKVIVTGCMVQSHKEVILSEYPMIDYMLGSGDIKGIVAAVQAKKQGEQVTNAKSFLEAGDVPRTISTPSHYAYLKIAEGCRKRCAYCIIPEIKGPLKSKPIEQIVKEFRALRARGVKEIILIAQDLGDWGKDIGFKRSDGLVVVLKELLKEEGEFWIRLLYLYPDEITDELIALMESDSRVCKYLDMPIQHVNNGVLKRMHRATTKEQVISTIEKLRTRMPTISIRTSLIVGFPGETKDDYKELCDFVEKYRLENVGIFEYSKEEKSYSAQLDGHHPESVKRKRKNHLAKLQAKGVEKSQRALIGSTIKVLIEGYHPESELLMQGRHEGQCPEIDGMVVLNEHECVDTFGEWYLVEITDALGYDLLGRVVAPIHHKEMVEALT